MFCLSFLRSPVLSVCAQLPQSYSPECSFDFKGKRKKHHGSDSSGSGGEISDLVQKLADKVGSTPIQRIHILGTGLELQATQVKLKFLCS